MKLRQTQTSKMAASVFVKKFPSKPDTPAKEL